MARVLLLAVMMAASSPLHAQTTTPSPSLEDSRVLRRRMRRNCFQRNHTKKPVERGTGGAGGSLIKRQ